MGEIGKKRKNRVSRKQVASILIFTFSTCKWPKNAN